MQSLFTQATVVVELLSAGYVATSFATYAHRRLNAPSERTAPPAIALKMPHRMSVFARSVLHTDASTTTVETLRQACSAQGIRWRDAHGKHKHLKKAEMMAALRRVAQAPQLALAAGDRPASPWESCPVTELRQQCQARGIRWRDAHGKNKHLKKAEMVVALQRLDQARRRAAQQTTSAPSLPQSPGMVPTPAATQLQHRNMA